jgi:hypothetical protein
MNNGLLQKILYIAENAVRDTISILVKSYAQIVTRVHRFQWLIGNKLCYFNPDYKKSLSFCKIWRSDFKFKY